MCIYLYQLGNIGISDKNPILCITSTGDSLTALNPDMFPRSLVAFCVYLGGHDSLSGVMQHLMNVS